MVCMLVKLVCSFYSGFEGETGEEKEEIKRKSKEMSKSQTDAERYV